MKYLVIAIALPLTLLPMAWTYFSTPSVFSVSSVAGVTVHCELLGDYPSDIEYIELIEKKSGRMIWRVEARGDMFQLHSFELNPGANPASFKPFSGDLRVGIPAQEAFYLKPGISYRASICSAEWLKLCRSTEFTL